MQHFVRMSGMEKLASWKLSLANGGKGPRLLDMNQNDYLQLQAFRPCLVLGHLGGYAG